MPSTIVHALLPASCVYTSKSLFPPLTKKETFKLLFLSCFLGNFPDLDVIPATLAGENWSNIHRNWGHNVFSITVGIFLGSFLIKKFIHKNFTKKSAFLLSFCLIASHIFFDSMQGENANGIQIGVPLLYPFSSWELTLPFKVFKAVTISHQDNFLTGYLSSMTFWKEIIYWEFIYIASFWLAWNAVFTVTNYVVKQHKRKKQIRAQILAFQHEQQASKQRAA